MHTACSTWCVELYEQLHMNACEMVHSEECIFENFLDTLSEINSICGEEIEKWKRDKESASVNAATV